MHCLWRDDDAMGCCFPSLIEHRDWRTTRKADQMNFTTEFPSAFLAAFDVLRAQPEQKFPLRGRCPARCRLAALREALFSRRRNPEARVGGWCANGLEYFAAAIYRIVNLVIWLTVVNSIFDLIFAPIVKPICGVHSNST